jgi:hypothetical protein
MSPQNGWFLRPMAKLLIPILSLFTLAGHASAEWKEKVLYSFQGLPDGADPVGAIAFDVAGNLYGATLDGGADNCPGIAQCGTVFQLEPPKQKGGAWSESLIYVFKGKNSNDGETPDGGVIFDKAGNLYGTTSYGGTGDCVLLGIKVGCGVVYKLTPPKQKGGAWTESVIYSFKGGKDGYLPNGDLTFDVAGNLYGATEFGGGKGTWCDPYYQYCGTVFELSPPKTKGGRWSEQILHSFAAGSDGYNPNGGLLVDNKGAVYGTTPLGGNQLCNLGQYQVGCGIAFKLVPPGRVGGAWTEKIVHVFTDGKDGAGPNGGLIFDTKEAIYGTAGGGGSGNGRGVVFRFTQSRNGQWNEMALYSFQGSDGWGPSGPVTFDALGNVYGTTNSGGAHFRGTFFRLKPTGSKWAFDLVYSFMGSPDPAFPAARVIVDKAGDHFYSTTQGGGTGQACQSGCGTVFEVWQ